MEARIPFIPLRGQTFFPRTVVSFDIGRDLSLASLEAAMEADRYLVVATQKDIEVTNPTEEDCYHVGTLIRIKQVVKNHEEYVRATAQIDERVTIASIYMEDGVMYCDYDLRPDEVTEGEEGTEEQDLAESYRRLLRETYLQYVHFLESGEAAAQTLLESVDSLGQMADVIASELDIPYTQKQEVLELQSDVERAKAVLEIINKEMRIEVLAKKIRMETIQNMNAGQREYFLREQLKVIKDELGENEEDSVSAEAENWRRQLDELQLEEKIDTKIRKEIARFEKLSPMSPDSNVIRTYVETVLELPWRKASKLNTNLKKAEKILNEDHYGLEKVKERILEYLAVVHLAKGIRGPIICLVGPPGVGKTSIARSIARATNREFIRMSLGGVRDEAEIRGHRRTYVGAIPGRIMTNISECGTNNPLFLFDEVDKIGADYRGDPASALLEVLDPEQNKTFTDHYLEIPFDLSKVMFITTANSTQTIPRPLLDRMEIIELPSYIEEEKLHIATEHLIPKQLKEHAIRKNQLTFSEQAVRDIIQQYTREAGVRNLERQIGKVCRRVAKNIVTEKKHHYSVTSRNLERYLGPVIYREDKLQKEPAVGVTTGMAWTAVGGVTLEIETVVMPGTGKLILTGQMGDVMKESAQTAIGYLRSIAERYEIPAERFRENDFQIHIPEGATPKDGPSAGVTMCSALFSALSGKKVRRDIAMTGEITLTGDILPIGGVREKVLAAYRQGITKILLPEENRKDIEEIPASVRKKMEFVFLHTAEDAFRELIIE